MTDPTIAAEIAQRTLKPGSGRCVLCGVDVWRYYTSGQSAHLSMFDERDDGSWNAGERDSLAAYVGPSNGWLFPHNCLEDAA